MADVKISNLPVSTTPLAGSEVLPIVQSTSTKKVSIADVTAGRDVSALSLTATNLKTSPTAANLDISGTTIAAGGTDANVDVNINAKGSGVAYLNQRWGVNQSGALVPSANNTYDIGNGSSNPRNIELTQYLKAGATISVGAATPAASGAGITFPATQSASTDANTLDDYEEGTWTSSAVFADATTGGNTSSTTATSATYTKVGRLVTIQCYFLNVSTSGMTAGNNMYLRGLPFTAANLTGTGYYLGSVSLQTTTFSGYAVPAVQDNTSYLIFLEVTSGNNAVLLTVSDFTSGSADVFLTVTYEAA